MKKNNLILLLVLLILLPACQSVKDGLSGAKRENSDEFLVKKKNPLVLPPKYMELPKPNNQADEDDEQYLEDFNIEELVGVENESLDTTSKENKTAEDFVLKNIKNN
tara:strand:+ start:205 stop:525 length:321 start_codon:yes stop_codon:yes gene_type:complete